MKGDESRTDTLTLDCSEPHPREVTAAQATQDRGPADRTLAAEGLSEAAVRLSADGQRLMLTAAGAASVTLGPYPNPAVARERLAAVRQFVTALLQVSTPDGPAAGVQHGRIPGPTTAVPACTTGTERGMS